MHVLTSIYETLDSFVVINQRLSYFIVNDITASPSDRIQSCDKPMLKATNLSIYLHGNPVYSLLDSNDIKDSQNKMISLKECFCGWKCIATQSVTVMFSVNGTSKKVEINECSKCSK